MANIRAYYTPEPARHRLPGAQRLHLPSGAVVEWEGGADLAPIDHLLGR